MSTFTPDTSGTWKFGLGSIGATDLYVAGKLAVNNSSNWVPGELYFNSGSKEQTGTVENLEAGKAYEIEIRSWYQEDVRGSPFQTAGAFRFGAMPVIEDERAIADAVVAAKNADIAIVVVGLNEDFESEGYDRKHMDLPGTTNKLVRSILEANPNTIVVNQTGTPVTMPWVDQAHSLVQAFYGGNSLGDGLADVLFGKVNPSSKLSLTFPKRLADSPSDIGFGITSATPGKTFYTESIYVGYRHFDKSQTPVLFPFGHGLSYTTFAYSDLTISAVSAEGEFEVSFAIKNTGNVAGKEAAQVYVCDPQSSLPRAVKELKGFVKVELQPGQQETVSVKLDRNALKHWDERRNWWIAEAGDFEVLVGPSSVDLPLRETVKLEKSLTWLGL
jgi:beta-glucosidase